MWLSRPTFVQNRWQSPQYMAVIQPEVQEEQEMQSAQLVTLQTSSQAHDEPPTAADATNLPTRTATKLATVAAPETVLAMSDSPLIQGDIASPWNASFSASSPPLGIWASRGLLLLVAAIWGTNFAVRIGVSSSRRWLIGYLAAHSIDRSQQRSYLLFRYRALTQPLPSLLYFVLPAIDCACCE
jgi:hypothetical protein